MSVRRKLSNLNYSQFNSLTDYNDKFMELIMMLRNVSEEDKVDKYMNGLKTVRPIYEKLMLENPTSITKTMHIALTTAVATGTIKNSNYVSKTFNKPKGNNYNNNIDT